MVTDLFFHFYIATPWNMDQKTIAQYTTWILCLSSGVSVPHKIQ